MSELPAQPPKPSLFRRVTGATLNYGLGKVVPQLVSFLLIPVFTAFLSPADYGLLEMAATFGAVLVIAMRFGVAGAVTRFYFDHKEGEELTDYVTTICSFVLVSSLLVAGITLATMPWLGEWVTPGLAFFPFIVLAVISSTFSGNTDVQRRLVQAREQSGYSLKLTLLTAIITFGLSVVFVAGFKMGAMGMLLAEVVSTVLLFIQAIHYLRPNLTGHFRWPMLRGSLSYAMGVLPAHAIGTVAPLATRSVLAHLDSLTALGLFSLSARFSRPLIMLMVAFHTSYQPIYFAERKTGTDEAHQRLANVGQAVWLLSVIAGLAMALMVPPVIVLMTPERFHPAGPLVPFLILGAFGELLHILFGSEIYFSKETKWAPLLTVNGALASLVATVVFVPRLGALGLAIATAVGTWATGLTSTFISRRLVKIPIRWVSLVRISGLGIIFALVAQAIPAPAAWLELVRGALTSALFVLALWLVRDPTLLEAVAFVRQTLARRFKRA